MNLVNYIENLSPQFTQIASAHGAVRFSEECHHAKQLLQENDFLSEIAASNPESLKSAILSVASAGITLNPVHKKAYLVPRKGRVCLDVSYRGMISLINEGGGISWMRVELVKEKDEFVMPAHGERPVHNFQPFLDRGAIVGGYAVTKLKCGDYLTHTVTIDRLHEIRKRSDAYKRNSGPWITDYEEMLKKTIVKQACKMLPENDLGQRAIHAIDAENDANGIDFEEESKPRELEGPSPSEVSEQKDKIIEEIKKELGELTNGQTIDEKGQAMRRYCGVSRFSAIKTSKKLAELESILEALRSAPKRANDNEEAQPCVDTEEEVLERLRRGYES